MKPFRVRPTRPTLMTLQNYFPLCPTVYLGDDGEICTAIATGGVIHPPGYPLFSLLARLALALVPGGEPAYRIGCLVAVIFLPLAIVLATTPTLWPNVMVVGLAVAMAWISIGMRQLRGEPTSPQS